MLRLSILLFIPLLFGFGKGKKPKTTKYLTNSYVYVPSGKVLLEVNPRITKTKKGEERKFKMDSCDGFYIINTEITN